MLFDNYDFDTYMAVIREGGREEGIEEGHKKRSEEIAYNLLVKGSTHEFVKRFCTS